MKYLALLMFIAVSALLASEARAQKKVVFGSVSGTVTIKELSGNNLGNFGCSNIRIGGTSLGKDGWKLSVAAAGDISTRKCRYFIPRMPAGTPFVVTAGGEFPKGCDLKVFKTDSSFPITVKAYQTINFSPTIQQITCTIVK